MKRNLSGEYRVVLDDGSAKVFLADNKNDARKMMQKWLTNECGFDRRSVIKRPAITEIEKL